MPRMAAMLALPLNRVFMWATECERTAEMITWFPRHVTMLLASYVDLVLAGVHDIVRALKLPCPAPPWPLSVTARLLCSPPSPVSCSIVILKASLHHF
jgi:hypothetical protein